MDYQHTLKSSIHLSGTGLHTGLFAHIKLLPAEVNQGIKFKRTDLKNVNLIKADVDNVYDVSRSTSLKEGSASVHTVEHLLAALTGMGIDNCLIEIDNEEVPILDGSAQSFVEAIIAAGKLQQDEYRNYIELDEILSYTDPENNVEIIALPAETYNLNVMIDFNSSILGFQHASLADMTDFEKQIAPCRTFCFLHEVEFLLNNNLIKGGSIDNAIVIVNKTPDNATLKRLSALFNKTNISVLKEGILNNVKLQFQNEPARHKLLDMIGDLTLLGRPLKAKIIGSRPGHKANVEMVKLIKKYAKQNRFKNKIPKYNLELKPLYDINKISKILPHKYPFLLVDKIIDIGEDYVVGIKNVTFNEFFFQGHFPGNPVMPGVLILEALAQTGGILAMRNYPDPENYDTYFLKIDNAKFKHVVLPGDTLIMKLELTGPIRRGLVEMKAKAFVGKDIAAEATMLAKIQRHEDK